MPDALAPIASTPAVGSALPASAGPGETGVQTGSATTQPDSDNPLKQAIKEGTEKRKAAKKATPVAAAPEAVADAPAEQAKTDPEQITAEQLFAPEALATPEGIARAREVVTTARAHVESEMAKLDVHHRSLRKRENKIAASESAVTQREQQANKYIQIGAQFMEGMNIIKGQRTASPETIMAQLDKLAGGNGDHRAGTELMEQILVAVARDGKAPEPNRAEQAMRAEIEALKRRYEGDLAAQAAAREAEQLNSLKGGVAHLERALVAAANTPTYPTIHHLLTTGATAPETVAQIIGDMMTEHFEENGTPLDMKVAIGMLEERASLLRGPQPAQAETGAGVLPNAEKPRTAARQSTVLPSDADRSLGSARQESADQRRQRLARDPNYLKRSGLAKFLQ